MPSKVPFLLGEHRRTIDDRFRLSIPSELIDPMIEDDKDCILAKEQPGALSLWKASDYQGKLDREVGAIEALLQAERLKDRIDVVQKFGRLLSTRHKTVQIAGRGRILLPEGFREFLGVDAGGEVLIVGAAICIEIWRPNAWIEYLEGNIREFQQTVSKLLDKD
jgi:MraZ protein